jgi:hypothetical protein
MTYDTIFSAEMQVLALYQFDRIDLVDILTLADFALQEFNRHWASWIATGDDMAYIAALAARQDRADLLAQVEGGS